MFCLNDRRRAIGIAPALKWKCMEGRDIVESDSNNNVEDIKLEKHAVCIPKEVLHSDWRAMYELIHHFKKGQHLDIKTLSTMFKEQIAKTNLEENSWKKCNINIQTDENLCGWSFDDGKTDEMMKNILMRISKDLGELPNEAVAEEKQEISIKKEKEKTKVTKPSAIKSKNFREERKYVSNKLIGEIPHKKIDIHKSLNPLQDKYLLKVLIIYDLIDLILSKNSNNVFCN